MLRRLALVIVLAISARAFTQVPVGGGNYCPSAAVTREQMSV